MRFDFAGECARHNSGQYRRHIERQRFLYICITICYCYVYG
jgi:hypothetical protein